VLPSTTPARAVLAPAEPSAVVKAVADGVVDTAAKVGAQVKSGDVVVRLKGAAQLERKLGNPRQGLVWDVEARYPNEIAKLTAARDKAVAAADAAEVKKIETRLKERTARLEEQKGKLAELRAALSALVLAAPADGVVASAPKAGQRVAAGQDVVALAGAPGLMATFELAGGPAPAPGATVNVAAEAAPDKPVPCVVAAVEGSRVMVTCPEQAGLAAGPALLSLTAP
jgi:hypothetical protein